MSNSVVHAFFLGRALAQAIVEQVEHSLTDALSELGKFDAEQRERLRQFTEQVMERAQQAEATSGVSTAGTASGPATETDLQALIDDLRAETARLRSELQQYRNQAN